MRAAQEAVRTDAQGRDPAAEGPERRGAGVRRLHRVGTVATIVRYMTAPDGTHHLICAGRAALPRRSTHARGLPFLVARFEFLTDTGLTHPEVEARALHAEAEGRRGDRAAAAGAARARARVQQIDRPARSPTSVASFIDVKPAEKQEILETLDARERGSTRCSTFLAHRVEVLKLSREIGEQTREAIDERQREYVLREQLRTIQKELGEDDDAATRSRSSTRRSTKAGMPEEVEKQARKELRRLERMPEAAASTRWCARTSTGWSRCRGRSSTTRTIDIAEARDDPRRGPLRPRRRSSAASSSTSRCASSIREGRSPILCFVGPPGVGKTSLGQSIARALGLKFLRVSLGGVHDEAEIRGHRRTYIGALPGNIIQAIRKAGTRNPCSCSTRSTSSARGFQGDPSSALLEVLDPEQNSTFRDNYLGVPFDLSKVLFIATANVLDTIPGPLRDRMEIIELTGYTEEEKLEIAHALPRAAPARGQRPAGRAGRDHRRRAAR